MKKICIVEVFRVNVLKLIHRATFNKKARMEMLGIAAPAKTVLVLKFAIFVVVHDNRGKGVGP